MRLILGIKAKAYDDDGTLVRECDVHVDGDIDSCENENFYDTFTKAEGLVKQALSCERRG